MLKTLLSTIILLLVMFTPIGIAVATVLLMKRWERRSDRRSPIELARLQLERERRYGDTLIRIFRP